MKKCSKCGTSKPACEFHADRTKKDGLSSACKSCAIQRSSDWYQANKERALAVAKAAYALNPKVKNEQARRWRMKNIDYKRQSDAAWRMANQDAVRASKMRRKVTKVRRTRPYDAELFKLVETEAHSLAILRKNATGIEWHVDHVVPLRSNIVSGFHNEFNLAVITAKENLIKGNRFWPDKP